jgi:hypothetical protein
MRSTQSNTQCILFIATTLHRIAFQKDSERGQKKGREAISDGQRPLQGELESYGRWRRDLGFHIASPLAEEPADLDHQSECAQKTDSTQ